MNIPENNPAGRVYQLFEAARKRSDSEHCKDAWAELFDLPKDNLAGVYYHLARVLEEVNQIERQLRSASDITAEIYLQDFPTIRAILSPVNFAERWDGTKKRITDAVLRTLAICADRLSRATLETTLDPAELDSLKADVESLLNEAANAKIADELKNVVIDMAEGMRRGIFEYRLRGANGLRQELFSVMEKCQRHAEALKRGRDTEIFQRLWTFLVRYDTITSAAINTPLLIKGMKNLLGFDG